MDPTVFDWLTRSFTTAGSRRRLLPRLVAALSLPGAVGLLKDGPAAKASHPVQRIQNRRDQHRKGAKRRQDRQHEQQTRDHGPGDNRRGPGGSDPCGGCPTGQVCCGSGQTAACCDPRSCCLAAGGGGELMCCPRPTCCLVQDGPICCLGICEINSSGNFSCR